MAEIGWRIKYDYIPQYNKWTRTGKEYTTRLVKSSDTALRDKWGNYLDFVIKDGSILANSLQSSMDLEDMVMESETIEEISDDDYLQILYA